MKKIAFVGAQGTGKTTLMNTIKKTLELEGYSVESTKDAARSCPFPLDANADFSTQFYIISNQINNENIAALKNPDFLLTDRCALDSMVYWTMNEERLFNITPREKKDVARNHSIALNALFRSVIGQFDMIFYLTASEFEWLRRNPSDGVRSSDLEWYTKTAGSFDDFIEKNGIKTIKIDSETPLQKIVETVMDAIKYKRIQVVEQKIEIPESVCAP